MSSEQPPQPPVPGSGGDPFAPPPSTPAQASPPPATQPVAPVPAPPPPPPPGYATGYPSAQYPPAGYGPTGYLAPRQTCGKAIASMVLGICGLVGVCFYGIGLIAGIVGLVLGYVAKREIRDSDGRLNGSGMATAGIVLGWVCVALLIVLIGFVIVALIASSQSTSIGQSTSIQ